MERFLYLLGILFLATLAVGARNSILGQNGDRSLLHVQCRASLQSQIDMELNASLTYMNMAAHFQRLDVGRKGFAKFFHHASDEEKEHAKKLIHYITRRGSIVQAFNVPMPVQHKIVDAQSALRAALALEELVNNRLHEVHEIAENECKDPHLMDFLESEFLEEQIQSIAELKRLITVLSKMPDGMGEYLLDRELEDKSDL